MEGIPIQLHTYVPGGIIDNKSVTLIILHIPAREERERERDRKKERERGSERKKDRKR